MEKASFGRGWETTFNRIVSTTKEWIMPLYMIFILVLAGCSVGKALGLIIRMKSNPELQGKGLKVLFQRDRGQSEEK
ncbi:MAG: hypothetical protein E7L40_03345 [Corynebacterium kroppenstedtii]|nr:hypothetical protein [Corynebacterium kroppenstedtii]